VGINQAKTGRVSARDLRLGLGCSSFAWSHGVASCRRVTKTAHYALLESPPGVWVGSFVLGLEGVRVLSRVGDLMASAAVSEAASLAICVARSVEAALLYVCLSNGLVRRTTQLSRARGWVPMRMSSLAGSGFGFAPAGARASRRCKASRQIRRIRLRRAACLALRLETTNAQKAIWVFFEPCSEIGAVSVSETSEVSEASGVGGVGGLRRSQ
jgi:hypothetical protein